MNLCRNISTNLLLLITVLALAFARVSDVSAQQINSYACDFEDEAENALWTINAQSSSPCKNQWHIGAAGAFGINSTKGLYISGGDGEEVEKNVYVNALGVDPTSQEAIQGEYVASYRQLDLADGTYTLVFDWLAMGRQDDKLFVTWVNPDEEPYIIPGVPQVGRAILSYSNTSTPPAYCSNIPSYRGSGSWHSVATTITVSGGQGGKLVIAWFLKAGVYPSNPAPAVDNIFIYQGTCSAPSSVVYDGNTSSLKWNGSAGYYDVIMTNLNTGSTSTFENVTGKSLQLTGMSEEGMYYFYVRSVCDEVRHSQWVLVRKFIWIKGARCIDLFDLGPDYSHAGVCYVGDFDTFIRYSRQGSLGMVDNGFASDASMHTIHVERDEIDPNTHENGGLHTVPNGEIATVRLGAYTASGQSARVEYKYTVTPGMSDLLDLKYAVVMESGGHGSSLADTDMNPTFTLNILDGSGREADACVQRYFVAGYGGQGNWHQEGDWYWCDWSTITVSLRQYVGQTITLRFTSTRCSYDTHPAYAYFTFNCRGGDLQGVSCGDFSTDHFEAPEGFNYRWYKASDTQKTDIRGELSRFDLEANDTTVYLVDLITPGQQDCYYTLEANPNPRFPQAKANYTHRVQNCQNLVTFTNLSRIVYINRITLDSVISDIPIGDVRWNFGDGTELQDPGQAFTHEYPANGGEFEVLCIASMNGGICVDTLHINLSLPHLHEDVHEVTHICGEGTDHTDVTTGINQYGCDYTAYHEYYYHPVFDTLYNERMCEGGRYLFPGNNKYYTQSIDTTLEFKSIYNCDSIIRLHLHVDPKLIVEYSKDVNVCLDRAEIEIPYVVTSGMMDSIKVYFSDAARLWGFDSCYGFKNGEEIRIPIPNSDMRPDNYQLDIEFGGERCHMDLQHATLHVQYKSSIVMQTGGFIALYNSAYNGGFNFAAYEWYKDGVLIESNNAYVPASEFDINSVYTVRLRRSGESNFIESCPIIYNPATALDDAEADVLVYPTFVDKGGSLTVSAGSGFSIYSVLGTLVACYESADCVRHIPAPAAGGVYIILFDNKQTVQIVVR